MSVDYTRKHQWKITPKGNRYMKTYIFSTLHLAEKSRERNKTKKIEISFREVFKQRVKNRGMIIGEEIHHM